MTCGHETHRQVWLVRCKEREWTVPASCQLEAWDATVGKLSEQELFDALGLIVRARPVEADEDSDIAVHAVGLAIRYGHDNLAIAAETAGLNVGMPSVRQIYEARGDDWIL